MFGRRKIAALAAEFLGTGALTLLILSVQRSTIGLPFFVAAAAGLTLALLLFAMPGSSNGYFNPAITLGLWTARKLSSVTAIVYIAMQMLGAWGAYYLYTYFVKNPLAPVGGNFSGHILAAEAIGTGLFAFGLAAGVYRGLSATATAAFAGVALMVGTIAASSASIALLNPAVALGVRAWVWGTYVAGPVIGAVVGVNLYALLFTESGMGGAMSLFRVPAAVAVPVAQPAVAKVSKPAAKKKTTRAKKK